MHQFHKFILSWNSTCFGQFVCPSSGVYSLYTQQWCMSLLSCDRASLTNFFVIKPTRCTNFTNFILSWNSTCFGQFVCPSSGVYSLYTQQWYMSYRFEDSFRAGPGLVLVILYSWLSGMQEHMRTESHFRKTSCLLHNGKFPVQFSTRIQTILFTNPIIRCYAQLAVQGVTGDTKYKHN